MRRAVLATIVLPSIAVGSVHAQRSAALELDAELAASEPGAPRWFASGFELVEAQLVFDAASAVDTADALLEAARACEQPGVLEAAAALHELALATLEGPASLERERHLIEAPEAQANPQFRAYCHAARSRLRWLEDQPIEVLSNALAGLAAARESGDLALHLRSAWIVHDITEDEASSYDAVLLQEIEQLMSQPGAARFSPWDRLNVYWRTYSVLTREERSALLDEAARLAEGMGDLFTLVQIDWDRAALASETGDAERAFAWLESARAGSERLGHRRVLATSLEIAAQLALDHGMLERCEEYLRQATSASAGRGLPDKDVSLAHLRLRLALAHGDDLQVVALTESLAVLRQAETERHRGYAALREQFLGSERQRIESARVLEEARERSARLQDSLRRTLVVGVVVALALLVVLSLLARSKLQRANRRLQDEIRRTESEAQARRALELRMRQLERSESLGMVASGVAHDFNNLMVGVLGNSELLRSSEGDPERRRLLDAIASAGQRGARLCAQLQAYSGDEPLAFEPLELGGLVSELAPVLAAATRTGVELEVAPITEHLVIDGNRTQIEQALLNLVANSNDARARHVRLRLSRESLAEGDWKTEHFRGEPRAGECARIEVEDDGEGMSDELIERIFDPFFTTRFPGRGLGLAVVSGALRRHHGFVSIRSQPGAGTRFRLFLPLRPEDAPGAVLIPRPALVQSRDLRPTQPMRVLLVDDEADVREYVRTALQARGHSVVTASDSAAALAALPALSCEERLVLLVDLSMPIVDGRELVRMLRARGRAHAIVLMSGHSASHLAETARDLAVDGRLAKPFTAAELEATLALALDSRPDQTRAPQPREAPAG